nr:MAG TPA: hypothetical protein [Caudoviricetes sp.]
MILDIKIIPSFILYIYYILDLTALTGPRRIYAKIKGYDFLTMIFST